jgi:cytidylate kinase
MICSLMRVKLRYSPNMSSSNHIPSIIAIDGPAASGKSTVGLRLAEALGYLFFDTGVMYRAITWLTLTRGIDVHDESAVTVLAEEAQIDIAPTSKPDGRSCDVLLNGKDITWEIRGRRVDTNVSIIAAYPGVRRALSQQQRRIGLRGKIVMVGRDIGTVVLPNADLKIYLDATAEERAKRRYDEIMARGAKANYDEILKRVVERDRIDSTRDVAPLRVAQDAIVLNSDKLTADEVFEQVLALVK